MWPGAWFDREYISSDICFKILEKGITPDLNYTLKSFSVSHHSIYLWHATKEKLCMNRVSLNREWLDRLLCYSATLFKLSSRHLLVKSQLWKHQHNVWRICSELIIKTSEWFQWPRSVIFIVKFEQFRQTIWYFRCWLK